MPRRFLLAAGAGAGALTLLALLIRARPSLDSDDLYLDTATLDLTALAPRIGRVVLVQNGRPVEVPAVIDRIVLNGTAELSIFAGESEDRDGVPINNPPRLTVTVTHPDPRVPPPPPLPSKGDGAHPGGYPPRRAGSEMTVIGRVDGIERRWTLSADRDGVVLGLRGGRPAVIYSGQPRAAFTFVKPTPNSARPTTVVGPIRVSVGSAASPAEAAFTVEHS